MDKVMVVAITPLWLTCVTGWACVVSVDWMITKVASYV